MKAYKCDRCGGLYEKGVSSKYTISKNSIIIDLCEACTRSFIDWMTSEKKDKVFSGCHECKYKDTDRYCEPCNSCNHSYVDKFIREKLDADKEE